MWLCVEKAGKLLGFPGTSWSGGWSVTHGVAQVHNAITKLIVECLLRIDDGGSIGSPGASDSSDFSLW